jgi:hypothetical protein
MQPSTQPVTASAVVAPAPKQVKVFRQTTAHSSRVSGATIPLFVVFVPFATTALTLSLQAVHWSPHSLDKQPFILRTKVSRFSLFESDL